MGIDDDHDGFNIRKAAMWLAVGAVIFVSLWLGIVSAVFGLRVATAGLVGRGEAHVQIQSGPHRIVAYNHFFDLCAGIRTVEQSLDAQVVQLEATSDPFQRNRIQTNITGLIGHRAGLLEEYNANARKDYTEGQFRDSNLPYQLPAVEWKNGGRTLCGN